MEISNFDLPLFVLLSLLPAAGNESRDFVVFIKLEYLLNVPNRDRLSENSLYKFNESNV